MSEPIFNSAIFDTAAGACAIAWSDAGIARFQLPDHNRRSTDLPAPRRWPRTRPAEPSGQIARAITAARSYFDGVRVDFSSYGLDLEGQDDLFGRIYETVRRIPWGATTTYGALARELGLEPQYARDIGRAMARNPVPLIIPCHRVLAAGGKIGGFSAPGGTAAKIAMLEREGVSLGANDPAQPRLDL